MQVIDLFNSLFIVKGSQGYVLVREYSSCFQKVDFIKKGEHLDLGKYDLTLDAEQVVKQERNVSASRPRFQIGQRVQQGEIVDVIYNSPSSAIAKSMGSGWLSHTTH